MPIGAGDRHHPVGDPADHPVTVGVLALQGAFSAHQDRLTALGALAPAVRTPGDLVDLDAIVLPGGESTTMSRLLDTSGLFAPLTELIATGLPVFGTCAGMILVAGEVLDGRSDQHGFERLDITVRRNGYGRQLESFEADLQIESLDEPFHAVFIRAPLVVRVGEGIEVLATHEGAPVLVRDGGCTVASFHPELTADTRLHEMFLDSIRRPVPSTE